MVCFQISFCFVSLPLHNVVYVYIMCDVIVVCVFCVYVKARVKNRFVIIVIICKASQ